MNSTESQKLSISQTLSQVATGLIIALVAFLAFALDKRDLGPVFWTLVALGAALLVASVIYGGRGIARISAPGGLFNKQAWACFFGFIFLGGSIFVLGKPLESETTTVIADVSEKIGAAKARLDSLEPLIKTNISHVQRNDALMAHLNEEVKQLNERLSRLEALNESRAQFDPDKAQQ